MIAHFTWNQSFNQLTLFAFDFTPWGTAETIWIQIAERFTRSSIIGSPATLQFHWKLHSGRKRKLHKSAFPDTNFYARIFGVQKFCARFCSRRKTITITTKRPTRRSAKFSTRRVCCWGYRVGLYKKHTLKKQFKKTLFFSVFQKTKNTCFFS